MRRSLTTLAALFCAACLVAGQSSNQPKVTPGPDEPNWWDILESIYGLAMFEDLTNPVLTEATQTVGLFRKADPGPVVFEPVIAFGTENRTHGGWYSDGGREVPDKHSLWSYRFKNRPEEIDSESVSRPPLEEGSTVEFDPGEQAFGLWISNENFQDGGVYSQPSMVAQRNSRLASQPYKLMIYPLRDKATETEVPNAFLMGWEYSNNDDFQDVVCVVRNVTLVP